MGAVSNSSPLIYLSALTDLHLMPQLFHEVAIPRAVYEEVVANGQGQPGSQEVAEAVGRWIRIVEIDDADAVDALRNKTGLQSGETEAIILAGQLQLRTILLDDQQAVAVAVAQGLTVVRTPALYLAAKRAGLIKEVKAKLDALRSFGFHLRDEHYRIILERSGEL